MNLKEWLTFNSPDHCVLKTNGQKVKVNGVGWYYNKNFVLKNAMDREIMIQRESGQLKQPLHRSQMQLKLNCQSGKKEEKEKAISFYFAATLFVILGAGIGLAVIMVFCEVICQKCRA